MINKKFIALLMTLLLVLSLAPVVNAAGPPMMNGPEPGEPTLYEGPMELIAGKDLVVGEVVVTNDCENIYVEYILDEDFSDEGWFFTEFHLSVVRNYDEFQMTKGGNPIPGQFEHKKYVDYEDEVTYYKFTVPYPEGCAVVCDGGLEIKIATHAVIERHEEVCEVLAEAPYGGSSVYDYLQGVQYNGNPVKAIRSVPEQGLLLEYGEDESNFYSLGFAPVGDDSYDPYIIIEFEHPIINGEDEDIKVVEDTWGTSYPLEKAEVYVSNDLSTWTHLGTADNSEHGTTDEHTISLFDLGDLDYAKYVKIVDSTDRTLFTSRPDADGYDLNAVLALHDHEVCEMIDESETAWGDGTRFVEQGNWGTWFVYQLECPTCEAPVVANGSFEEPDVDTDQGWNIYPDGTNNLGWTVEWMEGSGGTYEDGHLELHNEDALGVEPPDGDQYAELDSDFDGPGGSINNEAANISISQMINTCDFKEYSLSFSYYPRNADSEMKVYWDDELIGSYSDGSSEWHTVILDELAGSDSENYTELRFEEVGTADSFGMFLDDVSVEFDE